VEVILVELADERGKVGVLEHAREDGLCELGDILDDKTVALGAPGDDVRKLGVFEHPAGV
jgi:hypothetical protein